MQKLRLVGHWSVVAWIMGLTIGLLVCMTLAPPVIAISQETRQLPSEPTPLPTGAHWITLSGTVTDAVTHQPIPNVQVRDVVSDAEGRFSFEFLRT